MNAGNRSILWLMLLMVPAALLAGTVAGFYGPLVGLGLLAGLVVLAVILRDYRVGTVMAMCLAPISSDNDILKAFGGLVLVSFLSFSVARFKAGPQTVYPPRVFLVVYVTIWIVAFAAALTQLDIPYQAIVSPLRRQLYTLYGYSAAHLIPAVSYFLLSILIANAVRRSERPERWLVVFCLSAGIAGSTFIVSLIASGYDILVLQTRRELDIFSAQANDWGANLGTAAAVLLFMTILGKGRLRLLAAGCLLIVLIGLALAFSRGGYLVFVVAVAGLIVLYRRASLILGLAVIAMVGALLLPDAVIERATLGMDGGDVSAASGGSMTDELTAGRGGIFVRIAPDILDSPVIGRGLGGMAWSKAFIYGRLDFVNPHNLYVETLLDVGFAGAFLLSIWCWRFAAECWRTSRSTHVSPDYSIFFKGLLCAFLGFLAMGVSNGHWYPKFEQSFLWMGMGILFAYWNSASLAPAKKSGPIPRQESRNVLR